MKLAAIFILLAVLVVITLVAYIRKDVYRERKHEDLKRKLRENEHIY